MGARKGEVVKLLWKIYRPQLVSVPLSTKNVTECNRGWKVVKAQEIRL
jgi:hypothetical protein